MCQGCLDAVNEIFPNESEEEKMDILWSFTAFPFCEPDKIRKQLIHLKDVGAVAVMREFDEHYDTAMAKLRSREGENIVRPG